MNSSKVKISVVIPTYNRETLLNYTLSSLVKQNTGKEIFEVVVCDDGSSDGTEEMIRRYGSILNLKYFFQEDLGHRPSAARNKGIFCSEGENILFVDAGVILKSDCLEQHIWFHESKGQMAAAIGYVYGFDVAEGTESIVKELISPFDPEKSIERLTEHSFFDIREQQYQKYNDAIEKLPAPWFYFWTCHVSAPRKILISIGGFDENFDGRCLVEDNELGYRLCNNGISMHLLRSAKSIHYPHNKNKKKCQEDGYLNGLYFYNKFPTIYTKRFVDNFNEVDDFPDINTENDEEKKQVIG